MKTARTIKNNIDWVGAIHWNRRLFDALIPLPDGTSYNAYIIRGTDKTALIDAVDPETADEMFTRIASLDINAIDYVIANHAEQDHAGSIPAVLKRFPSTHVIASQKCKPMLMDHLGLADDRITAVKDGETLTLGDKTLEFIYAPWVHWPETMLTYLREDRVLFPCDLFGSHLASSNLLAANDARLFNAAKRYYAEIMMPFAAHITKHLARLNNYDIDVIAPSHGPVYRDPGFILDAYRDWVDAPPKNLVILPHISMHGSTRLMTDYVIDRLACANVPVEPFDLEDMDVGRMAMTLVDAATLIIASPVMLAGAHPKVVYAAYLTNALRPKLKYASIIGSYGWGSKMIDQLTGMLSNLKAEMYPPVLAKGRPNEETYQSLARLCENIARAHKELR